MREREEKKEEKEVCVWVCRVFFVGVWKVNNKNNIKKKKKREREENKMKCDGEWVWVWYVCVSGVCVCEK